MPEPGIAFDGISLAPLLGREGNFPEDRTHFIQHQQFSMDGEQQMEDPKPFFRSAVLTEKWRLVNGKELYDIKADPGQQSDIAGTRPEIVGGLRQRW